MPTLGTTSYQTNFDGSRLHYDGKSYVVQDDGTIVGATLAVLQGLVKTGLITFLPRAVNMANNAAPQLTDVLALADGGKMSVATLLAYMKQQMLITINAYRDAPATTLVTGNGVGLARAPFAGTVTGLRAHLAVASSSGAVVIDVKKNGTSIMGASKLTIDVSALTSVGSVVVPVLNAGSGAGGAGFADDDAFTVDVTGAGTGAKGLIVNLLAIRA